MFIHKLLNFLVTSFSLLLFVQIVDIVLRKSLQQILFIANLCKYFSSIAKLCANFFSYICGFFLAFLKKKTLQTCRNIFILLVLCVSHGKQQSPWNEQEPNIFSLQNCKNISFINFFDRGKVLSKKVYNKFFHCKIVQIFWLYIFLFCHLCKSWTKSFEKVCNKSVSLQIATIGFSYKFLWSQTSSFEKRRHIFFNSKSCKYKKQTY